MDTFEKEWPAAKVAGPATITMNGSSIDDVLATVQSQMELLRTVVSQQSAYIAEMKVKEEENTTASAKYVERIAALEDQLKDDAISNIFAMLSTHGENIKELQERPIIDPEQTERLDLVEKKFASFYGDDTNILGRVQHLENHTKKDREHLSNARDEIKLMKRGIENANKSIDTLKSHTLADHTKSIEDLRASKMDHIDIQSQVLKYLNNLDVPHKEDISKVKDMVKALADDWRSSIEEVQRNRIQDAELSKFRLDGHDEDISALKENGAGRNHAVSSHGNAPPVESNTELLSRVSSLESRMARQDMASDRLMKVEEAVSQTKSRVKMVEGDVDHLKSRTERAEKDQSRLHIDMNHVKSQLDKLEYRMNVIDPLDYEPRSRTGSPSRLGTTSRSRLHDALPDNNTVNVGDKIEARYRGKSKYYPGVISRVHQDGTYDIDYDDGEKEMKVNQDLVRVADRLATGMTLTTTAGSSLDHNALRELQASVRDLQRSTSRALTIEDVEKVTTRVVRKHQDSLRPATATGTGGVSPFGGSGMGGSAMGGFTEEDHEDVDRLKDIAKELERRMYVMVEECHKGLETLQKDTSRKMHGMSTYLLDSNPPCECDDNMDPAQTSAMGDPLNLLAYRKCRRQCPACQEKDVHTNIPHDKVDSGNGGAKLDPLSLLAFRRCKRRCPACVEKERKMGLPDITTAPTDADSGERLTELEEKLAKQAKQIISLKEENTQAVRSQEDLASDISELKHTVNVDHKTLLDHLEDNKMDNQDIHEMIQGAVRAQNLPSSADIEALKNLCSLVSSESRDNLDGLKTKTEKKLKAIGTHLSQHDEELIDLKTIGQTANHHIQSHEDRLTSLEGKQTGSDSGGNTESGGSSRKLATVEQSVASLLSKMAHIDDEKKKQKGAMEGIRSDLTQLQHVVNSEHTPAIHKLQKKKGSQQQASAPDTQQMDEVIARALENGAGKLPKGVTVEDLDKVKRFVRELERRLFTLADECKEKFEENDSKVKNLGKFTAESIKKIVDFINQNRHHDDHYIPSFPEGVPHKPYHFLPTSSGNGPTSGDPNRRDILPDLDIQGENKWRGGPQTHSEPIHIDDPEEFDEYVRANMDLSRTQPVSFRNQSHSVLNRPKSAQPARKSNFRPA